MAKIIIDTDKWTTQQLKAANYTKKDGSKGVSIQYINKLINKGKLTPMRIEALGLVLVEK